VSKSATADFDARVSKDAAGTAEHVAILRDAPPKGGAPQDEVGVSGGLFLIFGFAIYLR